MKGNLYIDGIDVYSKFGVFIQEGGYNNIITAPLLNDLYYNDWAEEDGLEVDLSSPVLKTKEFDISFGSVNSYLDQLFLNIFSDKSYHECLFVELNKTFRLRLVSQPDRNTYLNLESFSLRFADDFPLANFVYSDPIKTINQEGFYLDDISLANYGVWVLEGSIDEIKKMPDVKKNLLLTYNDQAGSVYDDHWVKYQSKDVTLKCCLRTDNIDIFWVNYYALIHNLVKSGQRQLYVSALHRSFSCYYKSCQVRQFSIINNQIWCEFTLTLVFTNYKNSITPIKLYFEFISDSIEIDWKQQTIQIPFISNAQYLNIATLDEGLIVNKILIEDEAYTFGSLVSADFRNNTECYSGILYLDITTNLKDEEQNYIMSIAYSLFDNQNRSEFSIHQGAKETIISTLPAYDKQPMKYVRMEIDPVYDIDTDVRDYTINSIASDDWDKEIQSDPQPGGKTGATYPTRIIGEYEWTLQNMKLRYLPQGYLKQYALSQTALDKSNINSTVIDFIQSSGVPLSADIKTDQYLSLLKAYNLPQEYDDRIPENLFSSRYIRNCKVVDSKIVDDPDSIAWFLPPKRGAAFTSYVLSRAATTNFLGAYQVWGDGSVQASNNKIASNTDLSISQWIGSMGTGILFVVSTDGTKLEDLPPIKVEPGETPSEWNIPKYNYYQSGWDVASKEDYLQLFGMVGEDLSVDNLIKNLFVSPHDPDLPWVKDWILADKSVDKIGSRLLPCGHKQNVSDGVIMGYGERLAFGVKRQNGDQSEGTPSLYFNMQDSTNSVGKLVYDNVTNVPTSIKFWQRNYRFCRRLSDAELGYRMWRDDANDKIQVTSLSQSQPLNTVELEKGLLRGLAVRWMNKDKTEILIPLSQLEAETDKTKNDGEYGWYGFYE